MRILIVEDSAALRRSLHRGLSKLGFALDLASDGERGLALARLEPYDVIVLDVMLPRRDGFEVLRTLRTAGRDVPVLMLTAKDAVEDRVTGLRAGADDYLVKPFAFDELVARIEALARRREGRVNPRLEVGDLVVDAAARTVERAGRRVDLTAREYRLLHYLAQRAGQTISRLELEDHLYGTEDFPMSNAVPVAISALRRKLDAAGQESLIRTRRGLGYVLEVPC